MNNLPDATELIRRLAHQLTVLRVFYTPSARPPPPGGEKIVFPRLLRLTIIELSMSVDEWWPFDAQTPVLKSYDEFKQTPPQNLHRDTKTVSELRFDREIDFLLFPQVREVTANSAGVLGMLNRLEAEPHGWPDLKLFHCKYSDIVKRRLNDFNRKHGRYIRLINCDIILPSGVVSGSLLLLLSPVCMTAFLDHTLTPTQCDTNRECNTSPHSDRDIST